MTVVGARPQFIKAAIVSHALMEQNVQEILVHTGQHYDNNMSQIFFDELQMPAIDYHLGIKPDSHGKQTGEMIIAIETLLQKEKPDWLLIYGDTNSTLAAALAGAKLHIPIAHVEAGLRSYNRKMPEEVNRLVADSLAEALFTPTEQANTNLKLEGYAEDRIIHSGDIMYDAALFYADKSTQQSTILQTLHLQTKEYVLATVHRAENTDDLHKLLIIFLALEQIAKSIPVVMPLHPRTRKVLEQHFPAKLTNNIIQFIEPVGFLDMVMLEKNAKLIMTDSGGVQKEAFFYNVPCVTLREETEWVETVQLNWNRLMNPKDPEQISEAALDMMQRRGELHQYPYGKGQAAKLIAKHLK